MSKKKNNNGIDDFRNIKLGHRFSQISTDILFFVAFSILVIRVHPCPQNGDSYTFKLRSYIFVIYPVQFHYYAILN